MQDPERIRSSACVYFNLTGEEDDMNVIGEEWICPTEITAQFEEAAERFAGFAPADESVLRSSPHVTLPGTQGGEFPPPVWLERCADA